MRNTVRLATLALALFATVSAVSARDLRVEIRNDTGVTMTHLLASNKGEDDFTIDLFGDDILETGESGIVDFEDGSGFCKFDLRAIFEDGDTVDAYGKNVCEEELFVFN